MFNYQLILKATSNESTGKYLILKSKVIMRNAIRDKSYNFALSIVDLHKKCNPKSKQIPLYNQLLRSGTSIGANVEEAIGAQSRKDFISKMSISYKEARESRYWIKLMSDSKLLHIDIADKLLGDIDEICKILGKIISTSRK